MLAFLYPGIPAGYTGWPQGTKDAWLANFVGCEAWRNRAGSVVDESTYGGIHAAELALGGDDDEADAAVAKVRLADKIAQVEQAT